MTAQNTLNSTSQPQTAVDYCGRLGTSEFSLTINTNGKPSGEWLHENHNRLRGSVTAMRRDVETAGFVFGGYEVFLNDADKTIEVVAVYRQPATQTQM